MSEPTMNEPSTSATAPDQLLDHDYDGIREYDNPLPGWWVMLFVVTVVFSAFYVAYYFTPIQARSIQAAYATELAADDLKQLAAIGKDLSADEDALVEYMHNPKFLGMGRAIFQANCKSCHGAEGQGLVGPNLTDDYYKNVKMLADIPDVIANGANNGAMPSWKKRGSQGLNQNQIILVASYVASLRGKNLAGPRVAGDVEIGPWPEATPKSAPATTK